ncbi:MAG: ParA family protein [Anaerolineales bacterium]|nr:ParA family protein [Anaerolineales bacterium]
MGKCIGVLNYKGGTGKTTTVVNLGAGLALCGVQVLCVDLDAQGGLATCLGVPYRYSLTHMLLGQVEPEGCVVSARENLDIIPSDSSLVQAEGAMWRMNDNRLARQILGRKLQTLEDRYDYVLLDFSPSASIVSESGMRYMHDLIVPVATSYLAMVGTRQVIDTLKGISRTPCYSARLYLILPTFYAPRAQQDREVLGVLHHHFGDRVADPIRSNVKLTEAPSHHKTIFEYSPRSSAAADYRQLAERVLRER